MDCSASCQPCLGCMPCLILGHTQRQIFRAGAEKAPDVSHGSLKTLKTRLLSAALCLRRRSSRQSSSRTLLGPTSSGLRRELLPRVGVSGCGPLDHFEAYGFVPSPQSGRFGPVSVCWAWFSDSVPRATLLRVYAFDLGDVSSERSTVCPDCS